MVSRTLFSEAIGAMEVAFRRLEDQVPKPSIVQIGDQEALRYVERTIGQALIQKLARYISGLNAVDILLAAGHLQEQGVIQRTLDDIGDDITFLALAATWGEKRIHRRFLKAFWQEEFEEGVAPIDNTQGRYGPTRREIREAIAAMGDDETGQGVRAGSVLHQTYSGFVHAASPHIMEMCGGDELRFHLTGMGNTPRMKDHVRDAWNYIYRGLLATFAVAVALGDAQLAAALRTYLDRFEKASGTSYMADAEATPPTS